MRITVVVPTHNRPDTLRQCLAALGSQTLAAHEVIVVDDGPSGSAQTLIAGEFPEVHYLAQPHRGPASARNVGLRAATGEVVAFTDDDCVPPPDWLEQLAGGYARHPGVVGVGGGLIAPPTLLRSNVFAQYERYIYTHSYHAGPVEQRGGFECPAGSTANMSYTRSILAVVGGFDAGFPVAAGEDADLKLRITRLGRQLLYVPTWVIHLQAYDWARFRRQCYVRGVGRNYFEQRHGGGAPGRIKIGLRAARRLLSFPLDIVRMGHMGSSRLALVKLADGLLTCQGQWVGR